jgi:hypothetical protein
VSPEDLLDSETQLRSFLGNFQLEKFSSFKDNILKTRSPAQSFSLSEQADLKVIL